MLRRGSTALLVAAALAVSACGIKGPLRLPPKAPADGAAATTQPAAQPPQPDQPQRPSAESPVPDVPRIEGSRE
jgi:predicted small lipoprotein YifL